MVGMIQESVSGGDDIGGVQEGMEYSGVERNGMALRLNETEVVL